MDDTPWRATGTADSVAASSLWEATTEQTSFPSLEETLHVDVAVVGGGMTGVTAAVLLKRAGASVALIEAMHIGSGVSGGTTAHLTLSADARYQDLVTDFDATQARMVAESQRAAIERIAQFVAEEGIDCDFQRVPGYLYTESESDVQTIWNEAEIAQQLGIAATQTSEVPLPFPVKAALRFGDQAQFHPLKYLQALARTIPGAGCHLFERTRVLHISDDEPCRIRTERGTVVARNVILATHAPIHDRESTPDLLLIQSKISAYRSYVLGVRLNEPVPEGLFWDTDDPYHYLRRARDAAGDLLLVGGADHKTGHKTETEEQYQQLEQYVRERFNVADIAYRWSAQVYEPADGLPYIGRPNLHSHIYISTGYSGNGMTFGTLGGMILADLTLGRVNAWSEVYAVNRLNLLASGAQLVSETLDTAARFVGDRLKSDVSSVPRIPRGEGRIVSAAGDQYAVYRDDAGELHSFSPVCSHAGCIVQWNSAEKTWDCPCHGGRYDAQGFVLEGPPMYDLEPRPLPPEL